MFFLFFLGCTHNWFNASALKDCLFRSNMSHDANRKISKLCWTLFRVNNSRFSCTTINSHHLHMFLLELHEELLLESPSLHQQLLLEFCEKLRIFYKFLSIIQNFLLTAIFITKEFTVCWPPHCGFTINSFRICKYLLSGMQIIGKLTNQSV